MLLTLWLITAVTAWSLVFVGLQGVEMFTGQSASVWETFMYAGVTFSTLGQGTYIATTAAGRAATPS